MSAVPRGDLPVLAHTARPIDRGTSGELSANGRTALPGVQAAAVAAGGFVAGATLVRLVHRRRARSLARSRKSRRRSALRPARARRDAGRVASALEIVGSRSLLVDVHLLGSRD